MGPINLEHIEKVRQQYDRDCHSLQNRIANLRAKNELILCQLRSLKERRQAMQEKYKPKAVTNPDAYPKRFVAVLMGSHGQYVHKFFSLLWEAQTYLTTYWLGHSFNNQYTDSQILGIYDLVNQLAIPFPIDTVDKDYNKAIIEKRQEVLDRYIHLTKGLNRL